jgi:hypothetical protein
VHRIDLLPFMGGRHGRGVHIGARQAALRRAPMHLSAKIHRSVLPVGPFDGPIGLGTHDIVAGFGDVLEDVARLAVEFPADGLEG